jgi:hypothetical protein
MMNVPFLGFSHYRVYQIVAIPKNMIGNNWNCLTDYVSGNGGIIAQVTNLGVNTIVKPMQASFLRADHVDIPHYITVVASTANRIVGASP